MKKVVIFLMSIFLVWITHGMLLIKVSKMELAIKNSRKELETVEKDLKKKEIEYDALVDLERIGNEMKRKNMAISTDIKFFQINE